ncbi:MAG: hypothetical protein Q9191_006657 [Dirinaria sp. TL-2023a]
MSAPSSLQDLYIENAIDYVKHRAASMRIDLIFRAEYELRLLTQLDLSSLNIEYKIAWTNKDTTSHDLLPPYIKTHLNNSPSQILRSNEFDAYWRSMKIEHQLSTAQLKRYTPDDSLCGISDPKTPKASTTKKRSTASRPNANTMIRPPRSQLPRSSSPARSSSPNDPRYNDVNGFLVDDPTIDLDYEGGNGKRTPAKRAPANAGRTGKQVTPKKVSRTTAPRSGGKK